MDKQRLKILDFRQKFQGGRSDYDQDYLMRLEGNYWFNFRIVTEIMLNHLLVKTGKEIRLEIDSHKFST